MNAGRSGIILLSRPCRRDLKLNLVVVSTTSGLRIQKPVSRKVSMQVRGSLLACQTVPTVEILMALSEIGRLLSQQAAICGRRVLLERKVGGTD